MCYGYNAGNIVMKKTDCVLKGHILERRSKRKVHKQMCNV